MAGRPKKNADKMIGVKLSIADYDLAVLAAAEAGVPVSRWATSVVSAAVHPPALVTAGWSEAELPVGLTVKIDGNVLAVVPCRTHSDDVPTSFPASLETVDWKGVAEVTADLPAAPPRAPEREPRPITWTEKWNQIRALGPVEGGALFAELRNGRQLPGDFKGWPTEQKLRWLEREWPL